MGLDLTSREALFMEEVTEPHSVVAFPLSHLPRLHEAELKVSTVRCQTSSLCRSPYLRLILAQRHHTVARRERKRKAQKEEGPDSCRSSGTYCHPQVTVKDNDIM